MLCKPILAAALVACASAGTHAAGKAAGRSRRYGSTRLTGDNATTGGNVTVAAGTTDGVTDPVVKILQLGDSYMQFSRTYLAGYCKGSTVSNQGFGGSTATQWDSAGDDLLRNATSGAQAADATHVVLSVGGNDFLDGGCNAAGVEAKVAKSIRAVQQQVPGAKVVILGYPVPSADWGCGSRAAYDPLNAAVQAAAAQAGVTYLDAWLALGGTPHSYSDKGFFVDAIHPNKRGYCTVYTAPAVQRALECQEATFTDCSPGATAATTATVSAPAAGATTAAPPTGSKDGADGADEEDGADGAGEENGADGAGEENSADGAGEENAPPIPGVSGQSCATATTKPKTPTLCDANNRGCCVCSTAKNRQTFVFWPELGAGKAAVQRCVQTYKVPPGDDVTNKSPAPVPVVIRMNAYEPSSAEPSAKDIAAADRYGFAIVVMTGPNADGAGGFRMEFPNNGIANDAYPLSCDQKSTREKSYLDGVFALISARKNTLDNSKVFTAGFSQDSMLAIVVAACYPTRVAGTWQGGSGLAKTGHTPVTPGKQAQCSFSSMEAHEGACCAKEYCKSCKYWPLYPPKATATSKMVDCIMSYTDDTIACGSDWYMYEAMVAQGNDARLLSFPGTALGGPPPAGHSDPQNEWSWMVGCLGIKTTCTATCASSFATCVNSNPSPDQFGKFAACEAKLPGLGGCTAGCAPSLGMLKLSESAVVTLSTGTFGTDTSLPKHTGSAPKPQCTFGLITAADDPATAACKLPSDYAPPAAGATTPASPTGPRDSVDGAGEEDSVGGAGRVPGVSSTSRDPVVKNPNAAAAIVAPAFAATCAIVTMVAVALW